MGDWEKEEKPSSLEALDIWAMRVKNVGAAIAMLIAGIGALAVYVIPYVAVFGVHLRVWMPVVFILAALYVAFGSVKGWKGCNNPWVPLVSVVMSVISLTGMIQEMILYRETAPGDIEELVALFSAAGFAGSVTGWVYVGIQWFCMILLLIVDGLEDSVELRKKMTKEPRVVSKY
jgi:hypothetical protein